uniref:Uncharacterized protein n=1 Tax=Anguilla anguilla TaxID=7936 RepID=A0A0E9UR60_ANGAN
MRYCSILFYCSLKMTSCRKCNVAYRTLVRTGLIRDTNNNYTSCSMN